MNHMLTVEKLIATLERMPNKKLPVFVMLPNGATADICAFNEDQVAAKLKVFGEVEQIDCLMIETER